MVGVTNGWADAGRINGSLGGGPTGAETGAGAGVGDGAGAGVGVGAAGRDMEASRNHGRGGGCC